MSRIIRPLGFRDPSRLASVGRCEWSKSRVAQTAIKRAHSPGSRHREYHLPAVIETPSWLPRVVDELKRFYGPQPEPPHDAFGFFLWYVLGQRTIPQKRDAALAALKRIPALTPDALWRAPRAKLHAAVALVGPPEERLYPVITGVEVFRQYREIDRDIRAGLLGARRATRRIEPLEAAGAQWMLLAAGGHPILPRHRGAGRVLMRLGATDAAHGEARYSPIRAVRAAGACAPRDARFLKPAILYLSHHASGTCTPTEPHCRVCPLAVDCAYAAAAL